MNEKLNQLPHLSGSYQMIDENGIIIYVGKAKDLYKRVNSYFNKEQFGKTKIMVSEIKDITYIVTSSETEAFILELNLIKKNNPKYNILLKDDKSYPYIEYISKPYPKLKISRYLMVNKKNNKMLFGPYPNAYAARRIVTLLNRIYPLKKCEGMPKEVCLYYHMGMCLGYCQKNIDKNKLNIMEKEILSFLKGNDKIVIDKIKEKMNFYSESLNFEMAKDLKNDLEYIEIIQNNQKVELHDYLNRDIIAFNEMNNAVGVEIIFIRNGKVVGSHFNLFYLMSDLNDEVSSYLFNFYKNHEIPKEIIIDKKINNDILESLINTKIISPLKGTKKELLKMAQMNAKINFKNEMQNLLNNDHKIEKANEDLKKLINLKSLQRIEIFDISNLFGTFTVGGLVVYINGKPNKKEYRKYKISINQNDDYHSMKEIIYRRYYRVLIDHLVKPDLILLDGGVIQINACKEVLNSLNLNIKICGLKKNDKHETCSLIDGDSLEEIDLTNKQNIFLYLKQIQDEVHRYTINYHKEIRSKGALESILDNVKGVGFQRKKELIKKYGSLKKIKDAGYEELCKIVPKQVAKDIIAFLEKKGY